MPITHGNEEFSAQVDEPTVERPIIAAVIYLLGGCALLGLAGVIEVFSPGSAPG